MALVVALSSQHTIKRCGCYLLRRVFFPKSPSISIHFSHLTSRSPLKSILVRNPVNHASHRSIKLGWLLGPPPEPGSPEAKIKTRRLMIMLFFFQVAVGFYVGILRLQVYDEQGEFAPRLYSVSLVQEEERLAIEANERALADEVVKAKQAKLLEGISVSDYTLQKNSNK